MEELKLKCVDFLLTESMEKLTCWMGGFLQEVKSEQSLKVEEDVTWQN